MFHIVLFEPEIPPNTGNIIRLAANTHCHLHLIEPLGFALEDKRLRRAGLDYREFAQLSRYAHFDAFQQECRFHRLYAFTTKASRPYTQAQFVENDALLFGPETRGLPIEILTDLGQDHCLGIPMAENSRSLNLSNTVAIAVYEAWRQLRFKTPPKVITNR